MLKNASQTNIYIKYFPKILYKFDIIYIRNIIKSYTLLYTDSSVKEDNSNCKKRLFFKKNKSSYFLDFAEFF